MFDIPNTTRQWQELDKAHHIHPFTDPKYFDTKGVRVVMRGEGCYVWDSDGNKVLDGMAGLWCVNVGYGRKELVAAAARQMEELPYYTTHFQSATPSQIVLARKLAELTPGDLDHIFFANSGSEANDTVIRMVRHYWTVKGAPQKSTFIARNKAYHGSTLAATALGGMKHMHHLGNSVLPGFAHIMEPHWYFHGGSMPRDVFGVFAARKLEEKILEIGADKVAAFIGEPLQGAGGVIDPPDTYWPEIQRICTKYNILLVADEVICGFGRTGHWFGSEFYGIKPDIMSMAKGLSSGYQPISAVAFSDDIYRTINEGGLLAHGYTYSGHPVCCAVAIANLDIIDREDLVRRTREETSPYFRKVLEQLAASQPLVGEVRGAGLVAGLQLMKDRNSRTQFDVKETAALTCRDACLAGNLIVRALDQAVVMCPPLTISRTEIDELAEKLARGLAQTALQFGVA